MNLRLKSARRAVELDANRSSALLTLASALFANQEFSESLAAFRRAEALIKAGEKPDETLLAGLVITQWQLGDKDESVTDYMRLIRQNSNFARDEYLVNQLSRPEAETKPLRVALAETLRRHPELSPQRPQ